MANTKIPGAQDDDVEDSLFGPSLFANPDALAAASMAEAPPAQTPPSPSMINNVPVTGLIPKSFLEWGADPVNVAKVADPVPANTPMPSVVTATVKAAAQQAMQAPAAQPSAQSAAAVTPPFSPDVAGSPEAQFYGTPQDMSVAAPQSSGPGLMKNAAQPATLEDALSSGAPAAAATAAQSQNPAAPLNKTDFLAKNPVKIPGAPYVPHGGKLALTGLFAALDNAGAFLDHGTPTVGPGLMKNVQALQEYNQNLPVTQQQAEQSAYDDYLKQYGVARQNTLVPLTTIGPDGRQITTYVDPSTQKTALGAGVKAGATIGAAQIGAQSRLDVKNAELAVQQGQISKMVPGINPANNQPQFEAFNKAGQSLGFIDHSVVPGLMARTSSTVDYKEDGDGVLHALPKTTVSAPMLPGGARAPLTPPTKSVTAAASPSGMPSAAGMPAVTASAMPAAVAAKPAAGAGSIVPGFLGKSAKEEGYAYDGNKQLVYTSRSDANANGLTQFQKVSEADVNKDKGALRMLNDVQANKSRYAQAAVDYQKNGGNPDQDAANIAQVISDNPFSLGPVHLPAADILDKVEKSRAYTGLTPAGKELVDGYYRAMAAVPAYQKALTNIGRSNKEMMDLELNNIPSPILATQDIQRKLGAFQENIDRATEGIPKFKDVKQPSDIRAQYEPSWTASPQQGAPVNGVPAGAKVRDYTQLGK